MPPKRPKTSGKEPRKTIRPPTTGGKGPALGNIKLTEYVPKKRQSRGNKRPLLKIAPPRLQKLSGPPRKRHPNSATAIISTKIKADLLRGIFSNETGDSVFGWREEEENGYPEDLADDEKLVRAMNNFTLVDKSGNICLPDNLQFEYCQSKQEVHLVGWVTPLTVGPRRFFRVVSGYWPPRDWCEEDDNNKTVWRMNMMVLCVRIREMYWGSAVIYGRTIEGIFAVAWNDKVVYWLQHPATEYVKLFEKLRETNTDIRKRRFKDLDVSKPNDGTMHQWTLSMTRMELDYHPDHVNDEPFQYAAECKEDDSTAYVTDASSIPTDDEKPYPTGLRWRARKFRGVKEGDGTSNASGESGSEDGSDEETHEHDADGEDDPAPPEKRLRISEPAPSPPLQPVAPNSPPAPPPQASSDDEAPIPAPQFVAKGKGRVAPTVAKPQNLGSPTSAGGVSTGGEPTPAVDIQPTIPAAPLVEELGAPPSGIPSASPLNTLALSVPAPEITSAPTATTAPAAPSPSPVASIDARARVPPRRQQDQLDRF